MRICIEQQELQEIILEHLFNCGLKPKMVKDGVGYSRPKDLQIIVAANEVRVEIELDETIVIR